MAQTVLITLTLAGADTGPFDLYSNVDGFAAPFENNVAKIDLEAGYVSVLVPDVATTIRVQSDNPICGNYVDLVIVTTTTTSTTGEPTTTTTTTAPPTTTTTTTAAPASLIINKNFVTGQLTNVSVSGATLISGSLPLTNGSITYSVPPGLKDIFFTVSEDLSGNHTGGDTPCFNLPPATGPFNIGSINFVSGITYTVNMDIGTC